VGIDETKRVDDHPDQSAERGRTMKTLFVAATALLSLGIGSAYAGEGEGTIANTQFTSIPGVVTRAPAPAATAVSTAHSGEVMQAYVTQSSRGTGCSRPTRTATANASRS
jgi:hypothetical protein